MCIKVYVCLSNCLSPYLVINILVLCDTFVNFECLSQVLSTNVHQHVYHRPLMYFVSNQAKQNEQKQKKTTQRTQTHAHFRGNTIDATETHTDYKINRP